MPDNTQLLTKYRNQIDEIDEQILTLLTKRTQIVHHVGELKASSGDNKTIIRPGREAAMVRDILKRSSGGFPKAALAQLWRTIISAAINIEEKAQISVYDKATQRECFWLAREYFGAFTPTNLCNSITEIFNDIKSGASTVAVIPLWDNLNKNPWWLDYGTHDDLHIFARLPFIRLADSELVPVVALANVAPEPSGDDQSLWVFTVNNDIGFDEIEPWLCKEGFKCYLHATHQGAKHTHYMVEIAGFMTSQDVDIQHALVNMRGAVEQVRYLGSYATPLDLTGEKDG